MKTAYVFPGQGSQFSGMGNDLYDNSNQAKDLFEKANDLLGFRISDIMFTGSADELKQTKVTQPAIFLHSVIKALTADKFNPDMVAGHSLGELSALVANKVLSFEDGLNIVSKRAQAMQKACEVNPSGMAAILGLDDEVVEKICNEIDDIVVAANYNCPGQLVISGSNSGVAAACEKLTEAGARRALPLPVGGAFHSPLMAPAKDELAEVISKTNFQSPICPIYQNVDAKPSSDIDIIQQNLIAQLTAPVRWTQTIENMIADGAELFIECGPGKVLQGLVKKINRDAQVDSL